MIRKLWVQTPLGQFLTKFILFCITLDLSDYLTEMRQIGHSWKTQILRFVGSSCCYGYETCRSIYLAAIEINMWSRFLVKAVVPSGDFLTILFIYLLWSSDGERYGPREDTTDFTIRLSHPLGMQYVRIWKLCLYWFTQELVSCGFVLIGQYLF